MFLELVCANMLPTWLVRQLLRYGVSCPPGLPYSWCTNSTVLLVYDDYANLLSGLEWHGKNLRYAGNLPWTYWSVSDSLRRRLTVRVLTSQIHTRVRGSPISRCSRITTFDLIGHLFALLSFRKSRRIAHGAQVACIKVCRSNYGQRSFLYFIQSCLCPANVGSHWNRSWTFVFLNWTTFMCSRCSWQISL